MRVAINGFGRIGRIVFRILSQRKYCELVAINDITDAATLSHLLKYDSVHGRYPGNISAEANSIIVDGKKIAVTAEKDPGMLTWKEMNVDIVIESTGRFTDKAGSEKHLAAGARKVIISAPAKGEDIKQIVLGINENSITTDDQIISNASCTTNCAAPMVKILDDHWGIEHGFISTIHSFTSDQRLHDSPHKDLRRARAATLSIVPTTTGAARAVSRIFPHLKDKLDGDSYRVPVADGSIVDMVCVLKKPATADAINSIFRKYAQTSLKGILQYSADPIVSVDIIGNPHSCILDAALTTTIGNLVKIAGWYDNEYGYSSRLADLVEKMKIFL